MRQLTSLDSAFIYLEGEGKHNHLTGVYVYDQSTAKGGKIRFKEILEHVSSRLHLSPVFRQKLAAVPMSVDYPYWVDDETFDIEFHVRHVALPKPGDWRQFCILISRLHARALDMSRPAWEMYIVEGLDHIEGLPPGCFAVVAKYHHAAIDGATGVELLGALHDLTADTPSASDAPPWQPKPMPSRFGLLGRAALNNLRSPFLLTRSVAATIPTLGRKLLSREQKATKSTTPVPETRFNGRVSPHRVFDGREFAFQDFRAIKNSVPGTTVNDVVLAVVSGALRRYLEDKDELPADSLVAAVPINIRSDSDSTPGNQVAGMMCPLNTQLEDPLERLQAISEATRDAKETANGVGARQMTDIQQHIPSSTLALAGRLVNGLALGTRARFTNCIITNVRGPQRPIYKNGAKLLSMWGCGPVLDGVGLLILATSYDGKVFLSASSCRDMMPDVSFFSECLQGSFEDLKDAAKFQS
jgi:diacylglycerol O-acyltransferase